ncbi:MAG: hypothetical protein WC242_00460 [Candidatus Paceibacterota bacterium]
MCISISATSGKLEFVEIAFNLFPGYPDEGTTITGSRLKKLGYATPHAEWLFLYVIGLCESSQEPLFKTVYIIGRDKVWRIHYDMHGTVRFTDGLKLSDKIPTIGTHVLRFTPSKPTRRIRQSKKRKT